MDRGAWWLQSTGSQRVGHDWETSLSLFTFMHWRRKWHPTPVFLPGESLGRETWWAAICGVAQSQTRLKQLSSSSKRKHTLITPASGQVINSFCIYWSVTTGLLIINCWSPNTWMMGLLWLYLPFLCFMWVSRKLGWWVQTRTHGV